MKRIIIPIVILLFVVGILYWNYHTKSFSSPLNSSKLTELEARKIAERTCIKGGESLSPGVYNENTKTWWYDANLNAKQQGCNPACVVWEETKTAEINWRCTGLIEPKK